MKTVTLYFDDAASETAKAVVRGDFAIHVCPDRTQDNGASLYGISHVPTGRLIDGGWRKAHCLRPALRLLQRKQWPKDRDSIRENRQCQADAVAAIKKAEKSFAWWYRRQFPEAAVSRSGSLPASRLRTNTG